ncbi:MAG: hypothetical protein MRY21_01530 [Simkaniaceae bacterium]|nr:hypothetical protein [Simkaniaceae bacterium]
MSVTSSYNSAVEALEQQLKATSLHQALGVEVKATLPNILDAHQRLHEQVSELSEVADTSFLQSRTTELYTQCYERYVMKDLSEKLAETPTTSIPTYAYVLRTYQNFPLFLKNIITSSFGDYARSEVLTPLAAEVTSKDSVAEKVKAAFELIKPYRVDNLIVALLRESISSIIEKPITIHDFQEAGIPTEDLVFFFKQHAAPTETNAADTPYESISFYNRVFSNDPIDSELPKPIGILAPATPVPESDIRSSRRSTAATRGKPSPDLRPKTAPSKIEEFSPLPSPRMTRCTSTGRLNIKPL